MGQVRPWWDNGPIATASTAIPSAVPHTGSRVQEIRIFFVFIDFQRKSPPPTVIACAHRRASARTREWMARRHRARRPDT